MMKRPRSQIGFRCFPRKFKLLRGLVQAVMKRVRNLTYISGLLCFFVYFKHNSVPVTRSLWFSLAGSNALPHHPVILGTCFDQGLCHIHLWILLLVSSGCCDQVPQAGRLKQETFVSSPFWRLEVGGQGFGRAGFFRGLSPWLADGCLLSVLTGTFLCVHLGLISFCKGHRSPQVRAHPHDPIVTQVCLWRPSSKTVTFRGVGKKILVTFGLSLEGMVRKTGLGFQCMFFPFILTVLKLTLRALWWNTHLV